MNYRLILISLALVCAIFTGCKSEAAKKAEAAYHERTTKFLAARAEFLRPAAKVSLVNQPYLKGKTIEMFSTNGGELANKMIPIFPTPSDPDEIKTIIRQECNSVQKGIYRMKDDPSKTLPAMVMSCRITLIDRASSTAYYIKTIETEPDPEAYTAKDAKTVTKLPEKEIKAFLESLPRQ